MLLFHFTWHVFDSKKQSQVMNLVSDILPMIMGKVLGGLGLNFIHNAGHTDFSLIMLWSKCI